MHTNLKVAKFGGTSLADAARCRRVIEIIQADASRRLIVVSAPGKRHDGDAKITDRLLWIKERQSAGGEFEAEWGEVKERFQEIVSGLGLATSFDLERELSEIRQRIGEGASTDWLTSRGEYLLAKIMAAALGGVFVDAAEVIFFSGPTNIDSVRTSRAIAARCDPKGTVYVIPGFYGTVPDSAVQTFSRGGSDITGSLVAAAMDAELYENWTDVDGVYMTDPKVVPDTKPIPVITYRELRELSYMGATVLHDEAVFPVVAAGIPINVKNTFKPDKPGMMIVAERISHGTIIGIAGRANSSRDFVIITLEKALMNTEVGFAFRVLGVLKHHEIPFEHMPGGIDTLSLVVETRHVEDGRLEPVLRGIREAVNPERLRVRADLALICVVGAGAFQKPQVMASLFRALAEAGITTRLTSQGASDLSVIIGVDNADYAKALAALNKAFQGETA